VEHGGGVGDGAEVEGRVVAGVGAGYLEFYGAADGAGVFPDHEADFGREEREE
jgi:hypothetical protein